LGRSCSPGEGERVNLRYTPPPPLHAHSGRGQEASYWRKQMWQGSESYLGGEVGVEGSRVVVAVVATEHDEADEHQHEPSVG